MQEELDKLGWTNDELAQRDKADAGKMRMARRLRSGTSVTWKWITEHLKMENWAYVANRLKHKKKNDESKNQNQFTLV